MSLTPNPAETFSGKPALLTVDELAALLRVNRKTLYEAVHAGQVPGAVSVGRAIRIRKVSVIEWLAQGRVSRSNRSAA
jgi:excisionase family DNA binding protein